MMYLGWVGLGFGVVSRVFVPWLNERRLNPDNAKWDWRYVWPQLVGVVIAALLLPLVLTNMEGIGAMAFGSAYIMGWGAADIGRFADKLITKQ
jgi:hypothetical protein